MSSDFDELGSAELVEVNRAVPSAAEIIFSFALFIHRTEYLPFPPFSTAFFHHQVHEGHEVIYIFIAFFFVFLGVL